MITTIQRSHTIHFVPNDGWKRGVNYREIEDELLLVLNGKKSKYVNIVKSTSRYLEFFVEYKSTDGSTRSDEINNTVQMMIDVCAENKIRILSTSEFYNL